MNLSPALESGDTTNFIIIISFAHKIISIVSPDFQIDGAYASHNTDFSDELDIRHE